MTILITQQEALPPAIYYNKFTFIAPELNSFLREPDIKRPD